MKKSQTPYPKPEGLAGYLERMPQLRSGLNQVRASRQSTQLLLQCMPADVLKGVHTVRLIGSTVFIVVTSHEAAAWVRLRRSEIERAIADKALKFNEISVTVQSSVRPEPKPRPARSVGAAESVSNKAMLIESERMQTSLARLAETLRNNAR